MGTLPLDSPRPVVATCTRGLERVLEEELVALGHPDTAVDRGAVRFTADLAGIYRANLWLRTAMRVLLPLAAGPACSREELYGLGREIPWEEVLTRGQTFAIEVAGRGEAFASTAFAALTVKDALVDRLRERWGFRPEVDRRDPDLRVHLHLAGRSAQLALDSTGDPLSHRGYRPRGGPAPLAETLAAGVLLLAGYDGSMPLLDPMCGTGTLAIEAALLATGTPPGMWRAFACERWRELRRAQLDRLRIEAAQQRRTAAAAIVACDADSRAVAATRRNARAARVGSMIEVHQADVRSLAVPGPGTIIVTNPPYGQRLGEVEELRGFYRALGDALKSGATGCSAWLLVGNRDLAKEVGLRANRRMVLFNGAIECRLLRYDIH